MRSILISLILLVASVTTVNADTRTFIISKGESVIISRPHGWEKRRGKCELLPATASVNPAPALGVLQIAQKQYGIGEGAPGHQQKFGRKDNSCDGILGVGPEVTYKAGSKSGSDTFRLKARFAGGQSHSVKFIMIIE